MAKKKLLNEAQVRRFMSLSGIQPLKEMYGKKEEEMNEMGYKMEEDEMEEAIYEEEGAEEPMGDDAEMEPAAEEEPMDMGDEGEGEVEIDQDMVDKASEAIASLQELIDALGGAEGGDDELADEPMDEPMDEPAAEEPMGDEEGMDEPAEEPAGDEEEELLEALEGVDLQLSNNELVQEVTRRVAKRIMKAKRAQQQLDEALGNKKPRRKK